MSVPASSNADFARFVEETEHVTEAECFGSSFVFGGLLPDDFPPTRGAARALWWRRPERVRAPALQSGAAKLVEPDAVVDTQTSILDPKAGWHDFRLDLARVLYITLWLTLGLTTLRKGHTALFWFGIIFPVL